MEPMTLTTRMTRCPRPFDAELGAEAGARVAPGPLRDLVTGAAGCSPYLSGLVAREAAWLEAAAENPEGALEAAMGAVGEDVPADLRQAKRRVALLTALADLGGVWSLEEVTGALSRFADRATDLALGHGLKPVVARGKIPGLSPEDGTEALFVLAMGKMGAGELNYSSDIDLICLFDETRFEPQDYATVRAGFVRAVRAMCATLSDTRSGGYVFRTDLRLRPDPSVTPVVLSTAAAERYYESLGRTWERAAYIKARPAAGDLAAGARFLHGMAPFVWRKHLDYAAIEDAHNMRLAIRDNKGLHGPIRLPGHDMKLGRGGIREIEFFTQTRQLIAGGRDETLRLPQTVGGLARLAEAGWVPEADAKRLSTHYVFHRTVEHRLQMVQDAQTHALPRAEEGFARLAAMMDRDEPGLRTELFDRLSDVHSTTEVFFAPAQPQAAQALDPDVDRRWHGYPALRSERAQSLFKRIEPRLVAGFQSAARPEEAMAAFEGFLSGLPAGVQLFSLFEANPQLVDLLIDILSTAPPLASYLSRNAQVLDAVIGGDFFAPWPGSANLLADLEARLAPLDGDYEAILDTTRRWSKEWHFRTGVHLLRGLSDAAEAGRQYAELARAALRALWPHVQRQFARRHGPPPGRGAVVLGMGSVGAGRMTATSDLDMIVIYDPGEETESAGPKALPSRTYYARLTQALITALSAQTAEGRLYEVDMRLRPSGNQGPVATSWRAFQDYQQTQAWVWEHLALTRASVLTGADGLARDVGGFLSELRGRAPDRAAVIAEVQTMRDRIAAAKAPESCFEAKVGPGRLQDIEMFAQTAALLTGGTAHDMSAAIGAILPAGLGDKQAVGVLQDTYARAWALNMALRLVSPGSTRLEELGHAAQGHLCRVVAAASLTEAETTLEDAFAAARDVIESGLGAKGDT